MATRLTKLDAGVLRASEDIRQELLDARASLPTAANSRSPYPTDAYARYVHCEFVANRLMSIVHLMALTKSNLDDKMPYAEATRWLRRAERYAEQWAVQAERRQPADRPLLIPVRRETRVQSGFDLAELALVQDDDDPQVLKAAIEHGRAQIDATEEVVVACERRYVSLVGSAS